MDIEILKVILQSITSLGFVILIWQLIAMKRQYQDDHDRSRRKTVIDLQQFWTKTMEAKTRHSRLFIDHMGPDICTKFWNKEDLEIANQHTELLMHLFECTLDDLKKTANGDIEISGKHLQLLRQYLVGYLNVLEIIFTAWNANVGDRQMIEAEFGHNISVDGRFPLETIVTHAKENYFPYIREYITYKKNSETKPPKRKLLAPKKL